VDRINAPDPPAAAVVAAYPAHLHMDLLDRARGRGVGRMLMDRLLTELHARGVSAVHLGADPANDTAIGFYGHLGFSVLERLSDVVWMGLRLDR